MRVSTVIVKALKSLELPSDYVRELRALFVAQAIGYQVAVDPQQSAEANAEAHLSHFKKVLNEVNEFLPVDTQLALSQFKRFIAGRLELINGVRDPALLVAALRSQATADEFGKDYGNLITTLVTLSKFGDAQEAVCEALSDMSAASAE